MELLERRGDRQVAVWLLHREACDVHLMRPERSAVSRCGREARKDVDGAAGQRSRCRWDEQGAQPRH